MSRKHTHTYTNRQKYRHTNISHLSFAFYLFWIKHYPLSLPGLLLSLSDEGQTHWAYVPPSLITQSNIKLVQFASAHSSSTAYCQLAPHVYVCVCVCVCVHTSSTFVLFTGPPPPQGAPPWQREVQDLEPAERWNILWCTWSTAVSKQRWLALLIKPFVVALLRNSLRRNRQLVLLIWMQVCWLH